MGALSLFQMAAPWKNFKTAMKEKRIGKRKAPSHDILQKEEIVIQRLSAEVSGKAQKYSCVGAREFIPYEYDEMTVKNIKTACTRHFTLGERMICDVLAGEQVVLWSKSLTLKLCACGLLREALEMVPAWQETTWNVTNNLKDHSRGQRHSRYQLSEAKAQVKSSQRVCRC